MIFGVIGKYAQRFMDALKALVYGSPPKLDAPSTEPPDMTSVVAASA